MRLDILWIANARIFVTQPDTMGQNTIAERPVFLGKPVRHRCHFGKAHPRPDQPDIGHHVVVGDPVEGLLIRGRGGIAHNPASRDVATIAISAD